MMYQAMPRLRVRSSREFLGWCLASTVLLLVCASCETEETDWERAQGEDTLAAYEEFLGEYPEGTYVQEARSRVEALSFQTAKEADTAAAYEDYLGRYPSGTFVAEARERILVLTTGTITGQIIGSDSDQPLSEAQIVLCRLPESPTRETLCRLLADPAGTADEAGSFSIDAVPEGDYVLLHASQGELKIALSEIDGLPITGAQTCLRAMENRICRDEELPENLFWESGGTLIDRSIYSLGRGQSPPEPIAIGGGAGWMLRATIRSDRTGISLMIQDGLIAPVVSVGGQEIAEIRWEVPGR